MYIITKDNFTFIACLASFIKNNLYTDKQKHDTELI
jgi:hypothetical protein